MLGNFLGVRKDVMEWKKVINVLEDLQLSPLNVITLKDEIWVIIKHFAF